MTVVVGYIPDPYGEAALTAGLEDAARRGTDLVVVNATKGDALVDRRYVGEAGLADLEERLAGSGVSHACDWLAEDPAFQPTRERWHETCQLPAGRTVRQEGNGVTSFTNADGSRGYALVLGDAFAVASCHFNEANEENNLTCQAVLHDYVARNPAP